MLVLTDDNNISNITKENFSSAMPLMYIVQWTGLDTKLGYHYCFDLYALL